MYGESVDKIIQGNVANIIFLKSTDDSLLETLEKLSGTRHKVYNDSETLTVDESKLIMKNSAIISKSRALKEEPVISRDDMLRIAERNSIVFSAGEHPIWNRNEHNLPMAWRLHKDEQVFKGRKFTLKNVPTTSIVGEFDVDQNQPDFDAMLNHLMSQAVHSETAQQMYRTAFNLTDTDVERMDMNVYAEGVMGIIDSIVNKDILSADEQALPKSGAMDETLQAAGAAMVAGSASAKGQIEDKELINQANILREEAIKKNEVMGGIQLNPQTIIDLGKLRAQVGSSEPLKETDGAVAQFANELCAEFWDYFIEDAKRGQRGWSVEKDEDNGNLILKQGRSVFVTRLAEGKSNGAGEALDGDRVYNNTDEMREEIGRFIMGDALAAQLYHRSEDKIYPYTVEHLKKAMDGRLWSILKKVVGEVETGQ